jgi:hypothetical protein
MGQFKWILSLIAVGLIYYGSTSVYSFFATPVIQAGTHPSTPSTTGMLPGAVALIVGLICGFRAIFQLASSGEGGRRRHAPVIIAPPAAPAMPPRTRTLADISVASTRSGDVDGGANPGQAGRRMHAISTTFSSRERQSTPNAGQNGTAPRQITPLPPKFDPYIED